MFKFLQKVRDKILKFHKTTLEYRAVTRKSAIPSKAYVNWGIYLANTGKIEGALEKFESSSYMRPLNPESFNNWGIALASQGRYEEAIEKFREAIKIDPECAKTYTLWGSALVELERFEEAEKMYNSALELTPGNIEVYLNWGIALARRGKKNVAETKFRKSLELQPRSAQASFLLGLVLVELENFNEAIEKLDYSLKIQSNNPETWHYYAVALFKKGEYKAACEKAQTAIKMSPAKTEFHVNMAEILFALDKQDQAAECYALAEKTDPKHPDLYLSWGTTLQKQGKHLEAVEKLEKALCLRPENERVMYFLAISFLENEELDRSKELLEKVLEKDPRYVDAYVKLGFLLFKKGDITGAIEKYKEALNFPLKKTGANYLIACAYRALGQLEEAIKYLQKAIEDNPEHAEAYAEYALVLEEQGKTDEAQRKMRRANQLDPDNEKVKLYYNKINSKGIEG